MEVERRNQLRRHEDAVLIDRLKRIFLSVAVGYLILVAFAAGALYALERRDRIRLHDAATASCKRVNILREQENENALVIYGALTASRVRAEKLAKLGGKGAKVQRKAVKTIGIYQRALRKGTPTDCAAAVDSAKVYKPPAPRAFTPNDLKGSGLLIKGG